MKTNPRRSVAPCLRRLSPVVLLLAATCGEVVAAPPPAAGALEPFEVKDCTGPAAGKTLCYYCRYGLRPVVCVFTREIDDDLGELTAALDAAVARHREQRLAAFVVLLGDDTGEAEQKLRRLADRREIRHTPLTIYRDSPEKLTTGLGVSPKAPLTIRLWRSGRIVGEQRHNSGRLDAAATERLTADLARLAAGAPLEGASLESAEP